MARNRMIKPEFWEDEKVGQLSPMARLLFIGALNFADDEGFIRWNEDYISAAVFPYDKLSNSKTKRLMKELENLQIIEVFETKFHFFIAKILNFKKHQKISHSQPSKFLQEYESHVLKNQSKVEKVSGNGSGSNSWNDYYPKEVKEKLKERKEKEKKIADNVDNSKSEKEDTSLGEDPVKPDGNKGINGINDKTDFCFGERRGTANDQTARDEGITNPEREGSPPELASMDKNGRESASAEVISSTSVNTFKARVEYAKSLGIEERTARKICNFAQSEKFPLFETHYKGFVGKSEKEVEEAFRVLKLVVQRSQGTKFQNSNGLSPNGQSPKGLKRINSS